MIYKRFRYRRDSSCRQVIGKGFKMSRSGYRMIASYRRKSSGNADVKALRASFDGAGMGVRLMRALSWFGNLACSGFELL